MYRKVLFLKGQGNSHHYHPLALEVLGRQFGSIYYDLEEKAIHLADTDIFNKLWKWPNEHFVFSIWRRKFDMLWNEDQLVFINALSFYQTTTIAPT